MEEMEIMAVTSRHIWLRRNAWIFDQHFEHPNVVFSEATKSWQDFKRCNLKTHESFQPMERTKDESSKQSNWTPPPAGIIKVNWDASINGG
jgi:hypothetical protein